MRSCLKETTIVIASLCEGVSINRMLQNEEVNLCDRFQCGKDIAGFNLIVH